MYERGLKRVELWVTPDRKEKLLEVCTRQGKTQTEFVNSLLAHALNAHP